jgi:hypothetical protein
MAPVWPPDEDIGTSWVGNFKKDAFPTGIAKLGGYIISAGSSLS